MTIANTAPQTTPRATPNTRPPISILYEDNSIVAINKPSGLLVHRSDIDRQAKTFALQLTRDQVGCQIFPIHRLDRPTSGVLLFAKTRQAAKVLSEDFAQQRIQKTYLAVVRGFPPEHGHIDYSLQFVTDNRRDRASQKAGTRETAQTEYQRLATHELPVCIEKYAQSRYALIACFPKTGRRHQIRRHLKHISHPIIGDARYGRGRHNRYFAEHHQANRLLLHAYGLRFEHPLSGQRMHIYARLDACMHRLFAGFGWATADWQISPPPPNRK